jgi:hypothetical protein
VGAPHVTPLVKPSGEPAPIALAAGAPSEPGKVKKPRASRKPKAERIGEDGS